MKRYFYKLIFIAKEKRIKNFQNFIKTLKPYDCKIPTHCLQDLFKISELRVRRDYPRLKIYLRIVALSHQHRRTLHNDVIYAMPDDLGITLVIMQKILTQSQSGLTKQNKRILDVLDNQDMPLTVNDLLEGLEYSINKNTLYSRIRELEGLGYIDSEKKGKTKTMIRSAKDKDFVDSSKFHEVLKTYRVEMLDFCEKNNVVYDDFSMNYFYHPFTNELLEIDSDKDIFELEKEEKPTYKKIELEKEGSLDDY